MYTIMPTTSPFDFITNDERRDADAVQQVRDAVGWP
jgi:hypothetical protein